MARTSALLAKLLFGESSLVEIVGVQAGDSGVQINAKTLGQDAKCISCGSRSERVHSRYTRVLRDLVIAAQAVVFTYKCAGSSAKTPGVQSKSLPNLSIPLQAAFSVLPIER